MTDSGAGSCELRAARVQSALRSRGLDETVAFSVLLVESSNLILRSLRSQVTSALSRVEVVRAVQSGGAPATAMAHRQLARLHQVNLDTALVDSAASLAPGGLLRSLDAIHLASTQLLGADLRAVVTYDQRLAAAATALGLAVDAPRPIQPTI